MKKMSIVIGIAAVSAAMLSVSPRAYAAPQILGLVAALEPTKLTCQNGECSAQFSSFCLQEHRKAPHPGTAYLPSDNSDLKLVVTLKDGASKTLPAGRYVKVRSKINYTAMTISVAESTLRELGAVSAAIQVGALSSMIPVPRPADEQPQTAFEIAQFTGPLRVRAAQVTDQDSVDSMIARFSNDMINALPRSRPANDDEVKEAWRQATAKLPRSDVNERALQLMKREVRDCRFIANLEKEDGFTHATMRNCLGDVHGERMLEQTGQVWKSLAAGG